LIFRILLLKGTCTISFQTQGVVLTPSSLTVHTIQHNNPGIYQTISGIV